MTERPILFGGPMVRAILGGRKTQTRRIVKGVGDIGEKTTRIYWANATETVPPGEYTGWVRECDAPLGLPLRCPYSVGDRLWVRESWSNRRGLVYRADGATLPAGTPWRPSIHMPRWASRIILEVTAVRAERLQEISSEDARAEGIDVVRHSEESPDDYAMSHVEAFADLWDSINGKRAPWSVNPWTWVISFRRIAQAFREPMAKVRV